MDLSAIKINSSLQGRLDRNGKPISLINGFLPFQWEGIEFISKQERAAFLRWDTGTGKTVAAEATILLKRQQGYDLTIYVVKPNNLINAQRKLRQHIGVDGYILHGTPKYRERVFVQVDDDIVDQKQHPVLICNAEKFTTDTDYFIELITNRRLLLILDEATKWSNRATKLYRATCRVLYKSRINLNHYPRSGQERTKEIFCLALSATPITRSPENLFNIIRLIYPGFLGSITDFYNLYAGPRDPWGQILYWKNLDHLATRLEPILHQVSKHDKEIQDQFPAVMPPETIYCDMDPYAERLYNKLQQQYNSIGALSIISFDEILSAIGCLQMIASNPRAALISAQLREEYEQKLMDFTKTKRSLKEIREFERKYKRGSEVALKLRTLVNNDDLFTDKSPKGECVNGKLLSLKEILDEHDGKAVVFTTDKVMQDLISEWLTEWKISHVCFHGALTTNAKTSVIDQFRQDENIKVFLSTDAGQDSIDLPESSLTIHYDLPWSWSALKQRENRQHRIDSQQGEVRVITLAIPATVEDRKFEIIEKKYGYHQAIFEGKDDDIDEITREDWLYVLVGHQSD